MPSQNNVNIIINAVDKVTSVAKKVEDKLKKMGDAGKASSDKTSQATEKAKAKLSLTSQEVLKLRTDLINVGNHGKQSFDKLNKSEQDALVKFNMLDSETQKYLAKLNQVNKGCPALAQGIANAQSKFQSLENVTDSWSGRMDYARSKLQLLGTDTDSLKGKVQVVGSAVQNYLAPKWDNVKSKVSSVAESIKSKLSSAVNVVKGKVQSLADKFAGLGGVISSALGGIGLKSVYDMTVGLAIAREDVRSLHDSVFGVGKSSIDLFNQMDDLTTKGVVSLDELSSAMSTIKMSTGASNEELTTMMPLVNDIGQRAILMGKSGDEAISLMQSAGKGLNGEFDMLKSNFGVTKDELEKLGWDGTAKDVDGYTKALGKYMERGGEMGDLLDTTSGKMTTLQKRFRIAGRDLGEQFTPYLNDALDKLLEFTETEDGSTDKWLFQQVIGALALASGFATIAPTLAPILQSLESMYKGVKKAHEWGKKLKETMGNLGGEDGKIQSLKNKFNDLKTKISNAKDKVVEFASKIKNFAVNKIDALKRKFSEVKDKISGAKDKFAEFSKKLKENIHNKIDLLKQKFNDLKTKISDAKDKVVEFAGKVKTIATDKLDVLKTKIIAVKDKLIEAKGKLLEFAGKIKELAVAKITALKDAFMGVAEKISLATIKEKLYALWQGIINGLTAVWNFLLNMNPIGLVIIAIVALVATLMYLYNTNETVRNAINWLWEQLQVLGAWITDNLITAWNSLVTALQPVVDMLVSVLGPAIQGIIALFSGDTTGALTFFQQAWTNLLSALQPVSDFLSSVFGPAWDLIITCISTVWNTVQGVVGAFQMFLSGQISLPELLQTIWSLISNMYLTIFRTIINFVINFAKSIVNKAKNAGLNFLNGILNYIQQLPSRFISYLSSVVGGIISAGASWVNNARNKASAMVSGVISYVSQLPGKVYTEFSNIGSRILQAGSDLVNKAKNIGKNIVDGLLGAMGIHSPGTIQTSVVLEFTNMIDRVKDKVKSAKESAVSVAKSMVDGFKSQDVESALDVKPNLETNGPLVGNVLDNQQMTTTITPEFNESDNQHIVDGYNSMGQNVTSIFSNMSDKVNTSLNGLSSANEKTYSVIATTEQNNMNKMSNHVKGSMNKILNNTKTGLKNTSNTTNTNLKNMQNSTAKTTQKMTSAWNTMRVSIVNSASKIKSESTNHFSRLSSTIGGFYRKLQNPGGWGAGGSTGKPSNTRRVGHKSGGLKKITNAMKQVKTPQYLSLGQIKRNPLINSDFGGYITSFKNNKYSVSDLIRAGSIKIPVGLEDPKNKGAGGWSDSVRPNVSKIKSTARKWSMKGPKIVGKYQTSKGFKVGDFENGTPNIGFSDFKRMAEDVFSQCHYEFYYDSNKYGNWLTAFKHGGMNCSDSSDALIAMAHACGLSASKVHGHWNSFGHYWANVEGHKMDTTGYMNQRNWTPSQSHAGSPMIGNPFDDIIDAIKSLFEDDKPTPKNNILSSSVDSEYMELGGTVTIIHEFVNLPENISSEEVSRLVNEATTDDNWIKSLVKNVRFQNYDLDVKEKLIKKDNRARGV